MSFRAKRKNSSHFCSNLSLLCAGRSVLGLCANRHGQEGMDQSGSPRWLVTSDPWQASAFCAVATCKIPAASSSVWVEEAADATAVDQSPECPPEQLRAAGARIGSRHSSERSSQRTQKRGRLCNPRWRRPNDKRKRFLPRRSTLPERKALQKAEHDKEVDVQCVADGEDLLKKLKTQVADPTMPTFFFLRILLEKSPVSSEWLWSCKDSCTKRSRGPTTGCSCGPIINFSILYSEKGGSRSSDGTRGVGVECRPSRGDDCCSKGQESHRSSAHEATRRLQPESVPPSMETASKEARTISRYGFARFPVSRSSPVAQTAQRSDH